MSQTLPTGDPLEMELGAMRPAEPSPELVDRVARALGRPPASAGRRVLLAATVGTALAACVVLAVVLDRDPRPEGKNSVVVATVPPSPAEDEDRPALANYRRALARSPASLDDLLDRHAARPLAGPRQAAAGPVGLLELNAEH